MLYRRWMPAALVALMGAFAGSAPVASAQEAKPPLVKPVKPTTIVPADAIVFGQVRVADLWKSDSLKDIRDLVLKAGEKAIAAFDSRFLPTPSSIEKVSFFALVHEKEPYAYAVVHLNKPMDKAGFLKSLGKGATVENGGVTFDDMEVALWFIDESTFGITTADALHHILTRHKPLVSRELAANDPMAILADDRPFALGIRGEVIRKLEKELPPAFQSLARMDGLTLTVDLKGEGNISLRMEYANDRARAAAEASIGQLVEMGKSALIEQRKQALAQVFGDGKPAQIEQFPLAAGALISLGIVRSMEDLLNDLPLKKDGTALAMNVPLPKGGAATMVASSSVAIGLLLPAVQKVREAAARTQDSNNLKQIALAMHGLHDVNGTFPPAAICDAKGKPLLSWRVAILPYIEQQPLYNQFKLDEPWDSDRNKKLIPLMPKVLLNPSLPNPQPGMTHYRVFTGPEAIFGVKKSRTIVGITDGSSNTLMVVQSAEAVEWTKPDDLVYDAKNPLPKLLKTASGGSNVALGDGSVRFLRAGIDEKILRAMITANGGEVVEIP